MARRMPAVISEAANQKLIFDYLTIVLRKTVLVTNAATKKIAATAGVPDLLVTDSRYPRGCFLGLELKKPEFKNGGKKLQSAGKPSVEQRMLESAGRIYIVDTIEEASRAIEEFEASIGLPLAAPSRPNLELVDGVNVREFVLPTAPAPTRGISLTVRALRRILASADQDAAAVYCFEEGDGVKFGCIGGAALAGPAGLFLIFGPEACGALKEAHGGTK